MSNLQIAKWSGVSPVLSWWFSHYKNPKNKNGLTSLYLATFPSEFTIVKMQQSFEVELVHGLTPLHLAAFLREWIWDKMSINFPKNQVQKEYKMANYWKSSKCVILSWVYRLTLGYTRWKMFWPIFYSICCVSCKFVSKTASYAIKWIFYPLIKLVLLTAVWKPYSSHLHFPHTLIFHTAVSKISLSVGKIFTL